MKKDQIIQALRRFISQRSGIDAREYNGDREAFMRDYRPMLRAGKDARVLLREVELRDSITKDDILAATSAYAGRLQIKERVGSEEVFIDYTTGQYFPTEYRNAACAVLARCLWNYAMPNHKTGAEIRTWAKQQFGRGLASRWFN